MKIFKLFHHSIVFFCLTFCGIQAEEVAKGKPPTLHLIILADTLDSHIGEDVQEDVKNMVKEAKNISKYATMKLNTVIIQDEKATYSYTSRVIKNLRIGSNDAVIFYFSGHGYRTSNKGNNPWPDINLQDKTSIGVDFSLFVEQLMKKNPRFILAIADSCNNFVDDEVAVYTYRKTKAFNPNLEIIKQMNYQKLFLYSKGLVIASAAAPGEYGISLRNGGLYTLAFLESLAKETSQYEDEASWDVLMQRTLEKAVRTTIYEYQMDGKTYNYVMKAAPSSQWLRVEDIKNIPSALKMIGR